MSLTNMMLRLITTSSLLINAEARLMARMAGRPGGDGSRKSSPFLRRRPRGASVGPRGASVGPAAGIGVTDTEIGDGGRAGPTIVGRKSGLSNTVIEHTPLPTDGRTAARPAGRTDGRPDGRPADWGGAPRSIVHSFARIDVAIPPTRIDRGRLRWLSHGRCAGRGFWSAGVWAVVARCRHTAGAVVEYRTGPEITAPGAGPKWSAVDPVA